jgi:iron complex outermembrane recepter protein
MDHYRRLLLILFLPLPCFAIELPDIEEVVTIGTRVEGRTAIGTTVPIDVIDNNAIQGAGEIETAALLQKLAPSFNFSRTTIGDGTDIMRPATLRGLGPDQVLVLINGKRRHNQAWIHVQQQVGRGSAGTDLNAIPTSSIDRIEVLRDGAASQYGSDAISGIINIVLKEDTDETVISSKWGETQDSDGEQLWFGLNHGMEIGDGGFFNLTLETSDTDATNRAVPSSVFGDTILRIGNSEMENVAGFFNSMLPLFDFKGELYLYGGFSKTKGESGGFYRFPVSLVPDQANRGVSAVYPDGFLPLQTTESEDKSLTFGYRHRLTSLWDLDTSVSYGENEFMFGAKNTINASFAAEYVQNNPGATDAQIVANAGPLSGEDGAIIFDQLTFNVDLSGRFEPEFLPDTLYFGTGIEYREENYEIESGDLASWSCGAGGITQVAFPSVDDPTSTANCGFQGFPGYSPATAAASKNDRDNYALYVDLETDLSSDLIVGAALRYEDFSDAGDSLTGKFSGRYQFNEQFALRGAIATGFRAPSLGQRAFTTVITDAGASGLTQTFHAPEGDAIALSYGVDGLEHEESINFSLGLIYTPTDDLTISLDMYQIEIDDRVVLGGALDGSTNATAAALLASAGYDQAQFFSNAIDTKTQGADLVATQYIDLKDLGSLLVTAVIHHNKTEVETIKPPAGVAANVIFSSAQVDLVESGQPRQRHSLSFDWLRGAWSAGLKFNRYGKVTTSFWTCAGLGIPDTDCEAIGLEAADSRTSDAAWLTDLEVRYSFESGVEIALGGNNIFDEKPDKLADNSVPRWLSDGQVGFGNFQYPWESTPFGTAGAFYYARVNFRFSL